jgi:hypothetical protein
MEKTSFPSTLYPLSSFFVFPSQFILFEPNPTAAGKSTPDCAALRTTGEKNEKTSFFLSFFFFFMRKSKPPGAGVAEKHHHPTPPAALFFHHHHHITARTCVHAPVREKYTPLCPFFKFSMCVLCVRGVFFFLGGKKAIQKTTHPATRPGPLFALRERNAATTTTRRK